MALAAGRSPPPPRSGQATVEWVGLVALVAGLLAAVLWATGMVRLTLALPSELLERMACAVRSGSACALEPDVASDYGEEVAHLLRAYAPTLLYEDGMRALPVDFRRCRADACAEGAPEGALARSLAGEPVVAFTHAIDCRPGAAAATEAAGADCSDNRAGSLYLQYWFYYPGSATAEGSTPLRAVIRELSGAAGHPTFHPDDWESLQIRVGPDGRRFARASSHHGYSYAGSSRLRTGPGRGSSVPVIDGWGPDHGTVYVAGGSHAGRARAASDVGRRTRAHQLTLVPLRAISQHDGTAFAVTPPWRKRVYSDPEYTGTD